MAVQINLSDNKYIGTLKATAATSNGVFVTPDYSAATATVVASTTAGDAAGLLLVNSVNIAIDEQGVDDASFTTASGDYLRLKALEVGNIFTTDKFTGTYASIALGAVFAVGANGLPEAIGTRTPKLSFAVKEKTTLNGNNALKFVVLSV
jgi:hypothetical protein